MEPGLRPILREHIFLIQVHIPIFQRHFPHNQVLKVDEHTYFSTYNQPLTLDWGNVNERENVSQEDKFSWKLDSLFSTLP